MGLDRPLVVQYVEWVGGALIGDLGRSIQYDVPVGGLILSRLRVTLPLTVLAAAFMIAAAVPLGLYAATHHRRLGDYLAMVVSQLGIAIPSFWAGLLLILNDHPGGVGIGFLMGDVLECFTHVAAEQLVGEPARPRVRADHGGGKDRIDDLAHRCPRLPRP